MLGVISLTGSLAAQSSLLTRSEDSINTPLQVVPTAEPRVFAGTEEGSRWSTKTGRQPLSSFLDPMLGSDAVIELVLGQGRLLSTKAPLAEEGGAAVIAVGDPSVIDVDVLPNPRMIRLIGKRAGITDLTLVTSADETLAFEVRVYYDLDVMQAQLARLFPDAEIRITQIREHLIIEGQARSESQIQKIEEAVRAIIASVDRAVQLPSTDATTNPSAVNTTIDTTDTLVGRTLRATIDQSPRPDITGAGTTARLINLMTIPGVHQVLLQVRMAELNRTGMRAIGADTLFEFGPGNILGSQLGGGQVSLNGIGLGNENSLGPGQNTTGFGIFPSAHIEIMLRALRQNSLVRILAEPNLVALSGHEASFLAGGEFPVPVPQGNAGGRVTVQFKEFGVQLGFVPHILDDNLVRLEVRPEVSTIDQSLGTTLVVGGQPIPGVNTRRVHTTVEMKEGETLALAGLLQVTLDGKTDRIPGLGDLPYLGPMFSNTTHKRVERELLVLVTPYLVKPLQTDQIVPLPGEEVQDPDDSEFYFLNRIEGRKGIEHRSTLTWDDPLNVGGLLRLERANVCGPAGFTQ